MRGKRTQESDSPSVFEALCYSSPLWLLYLIHSFHAALYDSLPALPPNTLIPLSHLIHQSINLSITPSLPPFVCTQPYLPTTHALFLMHFVSPSCFFYAVQYRLFISVTSYSKVYTTSAPSCRYFGRSGQMSFLLMLTLSQLTKIVKTTREDWGPIPLCVGPWCQTSLGHFMLALILTVSQLSSAFQCTGHCS